MKENKPLTLCLGAGALGSNVVMNLAYDLKNEIEIVVLDFDKIEPRNITAGTQWYHPEQINLLKVEALQYNAYKWAGKEIEIIPRRLDSDTATEIIKDYDLVIDCFDNELSRTFVQKAGLTNNIPLLHCGFSGMMTFEITWAENYQIPEDNPNGIDVCEMPGARSFVQRVAGYAALAVEEFVISKNKFNFLGNKYTAHLLK